jgi:hypothetical protein
MRGHSQLTVLVSVSSDALRNQISAFISDAGYTVIEAASETEARAAVNPPPAHRRGLHYRCRAGCGGRISPVRRRTSTLDGGAGHLGASSVRNRRIHIGCQGGLHRKTVCVADAPKQSGRTYR